MIKIKIRIHRRYFDLIDIFYLIFNIKHNYINNKTKKADTQDQYIAFVFLLVYIK